MLNEPLDETVQMRIEQIHMHDLWKEAQLKSQIQRPQPIRPVFMPQATNQVIGPLGSMMLAQQLAT